MSLEDELININNVLISLSNYEAFKSDVEIYISDYLQKEEWKKMKVEYVIINQEHYAEARTHLEKGTYSYKIIYDAKEFEDKFTFQNSSNKREICISINKKWFSIKWNKTIDHDFTEKDIGFNYI